MLSMVWPWLRVRCYQMLSQCRSSSCCVIAKQSRLLHATLSEHARGIMRKLACPTVQTWNHSWSQLHATPSTSRYVLGGQGFRFWYQR